MIITKNQSFYSSLFTLAVPIVLSNLLSFATTFSDNLMIGTLGEEATAAVYLTNQVGMLLTIFLGGIEAVMMVFAVKAWGEKDTEKIKSITSYALIFAVSFALLLTIICIIFPEFVLSLISSNKKIAEYGVEYLRITAASFMLFAPTQVLLCAMRSIEKCKVGTVISLIGFSLNIALNFLLIFGALGLPALGTAGAAIATLISRAVAFGASFVYVFFIDKTLSLKIKDALKPNYGELREFVRRLLPLMAAQGVFAVNTLSQSFILARAGQNALTASAVTAVINNLAFVLINGMANAVGIISAKLTGEGEEDKIQDYQKTVEIIFLMLGALLCPVIHLIKYPILSFYNISEESMKDSLSLISVLSVIVILNSYQSAVINGIIKSVGKTKFVLILDAVSVLCFMLPLSLWALDLSLSPALIYLALRIDQLPKSVIGFIKLRRLYRDRYTDKAGRAAKRKNQGTE